MFKRALVSVSDKSGLLELLKPLAESGCEIVSTGGTSKFLRDNGLKVTEVAQVTGFPEMMDGRVRTLHPKIHMGLLARSFVPDDFRLLKEHGVEPFDLVVVNLYPFAESYKKGLKGQNLVEQIDIGGPSMLRAAAKSFERLAVVCDPSDYPSILEKSKGEGLTLDDRKKLAAKVFSQCAFYDSLVARALLESEEGTFPDWQNASTITFGYNKKSGLRYGENPHQKAVWYESPVAHELGLSRAVQLQGKELSYNNILDLEVAVGVVADFNEPACAIIKHLSPCGVAIAPTVDEAFAKAFEADSVSAFGGIVALNETITASVAMSLVHPFLECIIAPAVSDEAKEILSKKKNLRVLTLAALAGRKHGQKLELEVKSLRGGALVQTADHASQWGPEWSVIGKHPSEATKRDLTFAQTVVRHVKSNAIVIVKNGQTLGVCGGQTNRVDSVRFSLDRAKGRGKDFILGSDAFFPFRDSVDLAAEAGVKWIIQPGGSLRDAEVEAAVREHGLNMVITGTRHFKH